MKKFEISQLACRARSAFRMQSFLRTSHPVSQLSPLRRLLSGLLAILAVPCLLMTLTSCGQRLYVVPQYNFAGRPTPPSLLFNRVLVSITNDGATSGGLQFLDGLRDIRNTIQNINSVYRISGYAAALPTRIYNFPEQSRGVVYDNVTGNLGNVNYGTESASGNLGTGAVSPSQAISTDFSRLYLAAEQAGVLVIEDLTGGAGYSLNVPNVYAVFANPGNTVVLAMVRNSNTLYRVVRLNVGQTFNNPLNPLNPPGSIDCQPVQLPVYCVVPVPGTYDRPSQATFSLDGSSVYVLNSGIEFGGGTNGGSSVSVLQTGLLTIDQNIAAPYTNPLLATIPVPGGATFSISDGPNLYVSGQQQQPDGLFEGFLTTINLSSLTVSGAPLPISDGTHTKMLLADDNTLWIGSQFCANGERAKLGLNYNCLTKVTLSTSGGAASAPQIIPTNVIPGGTAAAGQTVPYPNENNNSFYYGSLTGLCWVQNLHKVYTAYGGQVHAFNTADGSEINNTQLVVQGTVLDVAYMDALTNAAN